MRNRILAWIGTTMTLFGTFLAFYFSPAPMPLSEQLWFLVMCAVCILFLTLTYLGQPRDLSKPLPPTIRGLAIVVMVFSGGAWAWFIVHTVIGEDSQMWAIRVQSTLSLFLFAGAYYIASQKPRLH